MIEFESRMDASRYTRALLVATLLDPLTPLILVGIVAAFLVVWLVRGGTVGAVAVVLATAAALAILVGSYWASIKLGMRDPVVRDHALAHLQVRVDEREVVVTRLGTAAETIAWPDVRRVLWLGDLLLLRVELRQWLLLDTGDLDDAGRARLRVLGRARRDLA